MRGGWSLKHSAMYAYLSGKLVEKQPVRAVLDVQGVGYELFISTSTFERLPEIGEVVRLATHFHVREDAALLYGFFSGREKQAFEVMLNVSGIGPRLALAALSVMRPDDIRACVMQGDEALLTRIPGVGRKMAQRMILELRDRFAAMEWPGPESEAGGPERSARTDALAALESLGYTRASAEKALRAIVQQHPSAETVEDMVRLALRER